MYWLLICFTQEVRESPTLAARLKAQNKCGKSNLSTVHTVNAAAVEAFM